MLLLDIDYVYAIIIQMNLISSIMTLEDDSFLHHSAMLANFSVGNVSMLFYLYNMAAPNCEPAHDDD